MTTGRRIVSAAAAFICMAAAAQSLEFNVPAGDLKAAIDAYALQAGVQLVYRVDDLQGLTTAGLKAAMPPREALDLLLRGTPLRVRYDAASGVVIYRASPPASAAEDGSLQVVTVTAQRRPQAAQSVPISLTSFDAGAIDRYNLQSLQDTSRLTPGLLVSAFSQNNPTIAIRGTSNTFSQIGVSKPVAVEVDDVFIPRNSAANFKLFDLDSMTVLKGPQGTLFGRNVTGGVISINTRQPSFDDRQFAARATLGNLNDREVDALMSVPLSDQAAAKLTTSAQDRDGYGRDRLTGREEDDIHSRNLRGQLRLRPSAGTEMLFSADYSRDRNGGRTLSSTTLGDDGDRRTSELGVPQDFARTIQGGSMRVKTKLGAGELTSITAYRKSESAENYSGVGANYSFLTSGSQSLTYDADAVGTFSQEFRWASPSWSRGNLVTGLYYMREGGTRTLGTRGLAAATGALASSTVNAEAVDTMSYAFFADGTVHLLPSLDLTAGARYTYDQKDASLTRTDLVNPANGFSASGLRNHWTQWTPRAALSWQASPSAMVYTSVTRGFTAGGFNADASSLKAFRTAFDPETVTSYEVGTKTQWLNNRLRFNLAAFDMKYKNKQELVNDTVAGILSIENAAAATVKGAEMELAWRPVRRVNLSLNYAHLDAVYDNFVVGNVNNTGHPLGSSPPNTWSLGADATLWSGASGSIFGALNYSHLDAYYTGATKDPNLRIPGYGLANANLGFQSDDGRWRVMAWVKNIGDTAYILTRSTQVVRSEYLGEPRTFGVTVTADF